MTILKRILLISGTLALLSVTGLAAALTMTVWTTKGSIARLESEAVLSLRGANKAISDVSSVTAGTVIQVGLAADAVNMQARTQEKHWLKTAEETSLLVADARRTLQSIDTIVLPQLTASMAQSSNGVAKMTDESAFAIRELRTRLETTLDETNRTMTGLANVSNSPAILDTLTQTQGTMANVNVATGELAEASKDVRTAVHKATRPPALIWAVVKMSWEQVTKAWTAFIR